MRRLLLLLLPATCWAGDYFECVSPQGVTSYQLEKCDQTARQKTIRDDQPPATYWVDGSNQTKTTQVLRSGMNYFGTGLVNGRPFRMMVDTGASFVSMSRDQALQSGIPIRGRPLKMQTANGTVQGVLATAESISFAGHEVKNVQVVIQTEGKPFPDILLGMSYLGHFDMNMNGSVMSLTRK